MQDTGHRQATVVIPSLGGRQRLPVVLAALEAQSILDFEVIVVLDGDIDGSGEFMAEYQRGRTSGPVVQVIAFPHNQGRAAALNAGFAAANGEVLIRCDDDLEPNPGFVAAHVDFHRAGARGGVGLCPDVFDERQAYGRAYGSHADGQVRQWQQTISAQQQWMTWSGNVSVRAEVHRAVGPYDPSYIDYGWEDIQWGYRLHQAGYPIEVVPGAEALHHNPPNSCRERALRAFDSGRARARFAEQFPQALPRSGDRERSPWNAAVDVVARVTNRQRVQWWARPVDAVSGIAPPPVARKLIALVVESAGLAGDRSART